MFAGAPAIADEADAPAGTVQWGVRTADGDLGSERENYDYLLEAGDSLDDAIVVTNHGDEPLELAVYAADGFTGESGALDLLAEGETSTAVGAWITADATSVHLEPAASVEVPFHVAIPEDAMPGDYAGGIVTTLASEQDGGVSVDRRLGIRVQVRVGGELAPALVVEDVHLEYATPLDPFATAPATVTYTVRNTGNARLTAAQTVAVAGPFGMLRADAADLEPIPALLPGESWTASADVAGVFPSGLLTAEVELVPSVPAEGTTSGSGDLPAVHAEATLWAVPWMLVAALLVLVGAVVALVLGRRRAKRREAARIEAAVAEALETVDA
nr:DUF916 domain-containing protein [Agromyces seonyuensis]